MSFLFQQSFLTLWRKEIGYRKMRIDGELI